MAFTYQELRKKINQSKRELAEIEKYLKEGESLEKDIDKNAYQIEDRLKKIEEKLSKLKELEELRENLKEIKEFADERKKPLEYPKQKLRNYLGAELDRRFREMGRHIEGNLPELKVELLTLEFLLSQSQVKIWYGPKIELLGRSKLIVDDITNSVIKIYKDLESTGFKDEQAFLKLLFNGFRSPHSPGQPVTCKVVASEIVRSECLITPVLAREHSLIEGHPDNDACSTFYGHREELGHRFLFKYIVNDLQHIHHPVAH